MEEKKRVSWVAREKAKRAWWAHVQQAAPEVAEDISRVARVFGRLELGPASVAGKRYRGDWE